MANITCAISGLRFECSYFSGTTIPHTAGYFHPIFAVEYNQLYKLYYNHTRGKLSPTDSYLTFLAFLHSSGQIEWNHPATLDPNSFDTKQLVENNFAQLIKVLEKTNLVQYSSFRQPSFIVAYDNSKLHQIHNWIKAWEENLQDFRENRADERTREQLKRVENKLSHLLLSGESPELYPHIVADWADRAANFPYNKAELYKKTIASCFQITKMFNTPLSLLKEIKDFCECNIEAGSIHFHALIKVLNEGIFRHMDYLGGGSLALGYTLLPSLANKEAEKVGDTALNNIIKTATLDPPVAEDYSSSAEFLKARLAYTVAKNAAKRNNQIKENL